MIVRNAYTARASANVERGPGEGAILPSSPDVRIAAPEHRPVGAKLRDHLGNQVAKRGRVVLIEFGRSGFATPFQHFTFIHSAASSQTGGKDNAA